MPTTPPVVSTLPPAPNRNDAPADFSTKADAFVAALTPMVTQENGLATWMNGTAVETQGYATAASGSASAASGSASAASGSASAAAQSAIDATNNGAAQVALAADEADRAEEAREGAEVAAAAAGAAAGLPSLGGNSFKVLRVKTAEDGVEWGLGLPTVVGVAPGKALVVGPSNTVLWAEPAKIGDVLISATNPGSLWLPADGAIRAQSAYPALFAAVGLVGTSVGTVWGTVPSGTASLTFRTASSEAGTVIVLANDGSVSRSANSGATFTNQPTTRANTLAIATDGAGTWIITTSLAAGTAYRSTDDGLTWNPITMPTTSANGWGKITYAGNNVWLAIPLTTANTQIARSTNGGATWANASHGFGSVTFSEIAADRTGVVLAATGTTIRRSTDYGVNWTSVLTSANSIHAMAHDGAGTWLISGTGANTNTYLSNNSGASFALTPMIANITIQYAAYANSTFLIVSSTSALYSFVDLVFTQQSTGLGTLQSISHAGGGIIMGATNSTTAARSLPYTYDPGTQFQVPRQPTGVGLTAYIKALEAP